MDEKRKFPRLSLNVEVEYKVIDESASSIGSKAEIKNISSGGVCIVTLDKFEIGTKLGLKFLLPETQSYVSAKGKVAWFEEFSVGSNATSKAYDIGVEFTEIKEEDRNKINQYIVQRLT